MVQLESIVQIFNFLNRVERDLLVVAGHVVQHGEDTFDPLQVGGAEDEYLGLLTGDFPEKEEIKSQNQRGAKNLHFQIPNSVKKLKIQQLYPSQKLWQQHCI